MLARANPETFLDGKITPHCGDCLDVLARLEADSIDSCVTDPPYHLTSIVKRFGAANSAPAKAMKSGDKAFSRLSTGFMGKQWDGGDIAFRPETWVQVYRALKPGAHLLAFGGTRTYHRMVCAIEDAGFEIRDMVQYLYGSGFPKSHSVSKGAGDEICSCEALSERDVRSVLDADVSPPIDAGDERREILLPVVPQQSPSNTMLRPEPSEGPRGADEFCMEGRGDVQEASRQLCEREVRALPAGTDLDGKGGRLCNGASRGDGEVGRSAADSDRVCAPHRPSTVEQPEIESRALALQSQPQKRGAWDRCGRCGKPIVPGGLGTALKPACEPIVLARKPLSESTVAANVLKWGTGALNIDGCRVATDESTERTQGEAEIGFHGGNYAPGLSTGSRVGRWPANVIHDGSKEVVGAFPDAPGQQRFVGPEHGERPSRGIYGDFGARPPNEPRGDSGSAARFFYTAKADADDRLGSKHPTVKPLDLMQYLVRLVTPKGGTVLDPFAGTGTTGEAAWREGMRAILIEREPEYQEDIRRRMKLVLGGPDERQHAAIKARGLTADAGPLFGGTENTRGGADRFTDTSQTRTNDRTSRA